MEIKLQNSDKFLIDFAVLKGGLLYPNVNFWWKSKPVQNAVNKLSSAFLKPSNKTIDCLMDCL